MAKLRFKFGIVVDVIHGFLDWHALSLACWVSVAVSRVTGTLLLSLGQA